MQFANVQFVVGPMVEQPMVLEQTPKQSRVVRLRFSLTLFEEPTLMGTHKSAASAACNRLTSTCTVNFAQSLAALSAAKINKSFSHE